MAAVPALLHDLACQWKLTTDGDRFWHGCNAVVFPVRQDSRPLALKLAWPACQARGEADALAEWRGRGIVRLAAADVPRGALLLERLDASRSLAGVPVAEAAAAAGTLIRALAVEASGAFPPVRAEARRSPRRSRPASAHSTTPFPASGSRWRPGSRRNWPTIPPACWLTPTCTTATSSPAAGRAIHGWRSTLASPWAPPSARWRTCSGPGPMSFPTREPSPACSPSSPSTGTWTRPRQPLGALSGPSTTGSGDWTTGSRSILSGASESPAP